MLWKPAVNEPFIDRARSSSPHVVGRSVFNNSSELQGQLDATTFDQRLWGVLLSAYRKCLERP